MRARAQAWRIYTGCGIVLAGLFAFVEPFRSNGLLMNLLGLSPVLAVLVGMRLHRPRSRAPWVLFAVGLGLFWLGDLYTIGYPRLFGGEVPFPSIGDGAYVAVYPVLLAGLLVLVRRRNPKRDRAGVIDALIMTIGLSLLVWVWLIAPNVHDDSLDLLGKVVSVSYPFGDVLLLAGIIRLAVDAGRREPAFYLLSASVVALLVTDFVYGLMTLAGTYADQVGLDVGWIGFYLLWGTAALHPSMARLELPASDHVLRLSRARLGLLTAASLIAPSLLLGRRVVHDDVDLLVVVVAAMVLFGLVVLRMAGLVRQQERGMERERELLAEVARRRGEARFAALVERSSDLTTLLDAGGSIIWQSPSITALLGLRPEEVVGRRFDELVDDPEGSGARLMQLLAGDARRSQGETEVIQCVLRHRDGSLRHLELMFTDLLGEDAVEGIVLNGRDVSERRAFEQQLAHQAFHDAVTGLANRALFAERVRHAVARDVREREGLAVLFVDLDDFKTINDSLGHAAGDEVLREVARRLDAAVRAVDTAARFGGDEFAVLLEGVTSAEEAAEVAERLLAALDRPFELDGKSLTLHASLGIALVPMGEAPTSDAEELIRDADAAMYIAKRDGKAGYRLFSPEMHEGVLARLELRADLQRALRDAELELHYQPLVRLEDRSVAGFEALLRWQHPERGLVAPNDFIPFAEETGLIVPIGRWVLREGCRQAVELNRLSEAPLGMSVNLSVKQLQHSDVVADVRDALEESGLEPGLLTLEITETVVMADTDLAVRRLHELKGLGVRLAMDDFGTGYSSLSYLYKFPVDVLKMDRSFLADDEVPSDLASAVVAIGTTLSLEVVAEGIEREEQRDALHELGCRLGQGFHFARPMVGPDALELARGSDAAVA